ncbi:MAG: protein kinase [Acidimicrobiales bacterium]
MDDGRPVDLGIPGLGPAVRIGYGGFAEVYRARQINLNRDVAVKVLRASGADERARMRFTRECHAVGAVSGHPNIVGVHEGGFTDDGRAYLVMELCPGGSLADRLAATGPLGAAEVIDIGAKIAKALAVAHAAGVVHRDVKPGNILVTAWGEPALADFGIARVEGGQQTATGQVTASLAHAAPEVLEGGLPTPSSDLYSLGSTLFELFTGYPPHFRAADASVLALMRRVLTEPIPDPVVLGMPPPLAGAVVRATARHAEQRFATGDDLAAALLSPAAGAGPVPEAPWAQGPGEPTLVAAGSTWTGPEVAADARPQHPGVEPPSHTPAQPLAAVQATANPGWPSPDTFDPTVARMPPGGYEAPETGRSRPARFAVGLVVAAVLVAVGVGGAALWTARSGADDTPGGPGGSTQVSSGTGTTDPAAQTGTTPVLNLAQAGYGPLDVNVAYPISVSGGPAGATYQLLVDDAPVGEAGATLEAFTPQSAGRHAVAVRAATGADTVTSEPVQIYVIGPVPAAGFRANLQSVASTPENWPKVLASFDELKRAGHTDLLLLPSDRFASLTPGYWNLFVAGFGDDREAAAAYCAQFQLEIPTQCYVGRFDPGGGGT